MQSNNLARSLHCGGSMLERSSFPVPPEYECIAELGRGGMGRVFECVCRQSGRRVAIKVSDPRLDEYSRRLCLREAWIASRVQHPNIARVRAYGQIRQQVWTVLDLVRGETLTVASARRDFDVAKRLGVLRDISRTVASLHSAGVVHRDIKADNIMIREDGSTCLIDFGIAKLEHEDDVEGSIMGTPRCMPPERLLGKQNDRRGDVFQIGVLAYELFAAQSPWPRYPDPMATAVAICTKPPVDFLSALRSDARQCYDAMMDLAPLVTKMLSYEARNRPENALELAWCVDEILRSKINMVEPVWVDSAEVDPSLSLESACTIAAA